MNDPYRTAGKQTSAPTEKERPWPTCKWEGCRLGVQTPLPSDAVHRFTVLRGKSREWAYCEEHVVSAQKKETAMYRHEQIVKVAKEIYCSLVPTAISLKMSPEELVQESYRYATHLQDYDHWPKGYGTTPIE